MPGTENLAVQVVDPGARLPIVEGDGEARPLVWPGIGAGLRSMQRISIGYRGRTVELQHPSESVYYVMSGDGHVREPGGQSHELRGGAMFLVEAETRYQVVGGADGIELVGGPCPPDPALYESLGD